MRLNRILGVAAALTLGVAIVLAAVVRAQAPAPGTARPGIGFKILGALNYISRELDLTAQQKQQIRDILRARRDDIKATVDQGFAARQALGVAITGGGDDEIAAAVKQVSAAELKGAQLRAQIRARIYSDVLQPDQRAKADQLTAQFEQKLDQWRSRIDAMLAGL